MKLLNGLRVMLHGTGNSNAKIFFLFDYPTPQEVANGAPGSGWVGYYIGEMAKRANLSYETAFRSIYCRDKILEPNKVQAKQPLVYIQEKVPGNYFDELLIKEINGIGPNVIVAVGETALQVLTGEKGIHKFRGSILPLGPQISPRILKGGIKVVPILHPRQIRSQYQAFFYTPVDLKKAVKYQHSDKPFKEDIILWVCRSSEAARNYFSRNKSPEFVVVDIETHLGFITCIGLSTDGREGVSFPLLEKTAGQIEKAVIYKQVAEYINSGIPIVGQNFIYDYWYLLQWGFIGPQFNYGGCTLNLGKLIYPELPGSLAFYNSIYTEVPYFKDETKSYDPTTQSRDQLYLYNAKDCVTTHKIFSKQISEAKELNVLDFWNKRQKALFYFYFRIDDRGILIDESKRKSLVEQYQNEVESSKVQLLGIVGKEINANSPKQVAEFLYGDLSLKRLTRINENGVRVLRTDEDAIEYHLVNNVSSSEEYNAIFQILLIRKYTKILSYLTAIIHPDGRMRTHHNSAGTESGRTSTNPSLDEWWVVDKKGKVDYNKMGIALQTFPKRGSLLPDGQVIGTDLREIFIPSPGYTFCGEDQSQAEARCVAILAEDYSLLQRFDKMDVHRWTAAMIKSVVTGREVQDLTKAMEGVTSFEREIQGKRVRHAGHYGMGPNKLSEIAKIPLALAKTALKAFHQVSPNIQQVYHREVQRTLRDCGYLVTPQGRRRDFFSRINNATFREAYSYIPQAVVSDKQKEVMLRIKEEIPEVFHLGEFHDGGLTEVPSTKVEDYFSTYRTIALEPIKFNKGSFLRDNELVIPIDCEYSDTNWGEMKKWKNGQ